MVLPPGRVSQSPPLHQQMALFPVSAARQCSLFMKKKRNYYISIFKSKNENLKYELKSPLNHIFTKLLLYDTS